MDTIPVFHVHGTYLFKKFFDDTAVFNDIKQFYNGDDYRFEMETEDAFEEAKSILEEHGFSVTMVEDLEPFTVVKPRSETYADILRDAVVHTTRGDYNVFVMRDEATAEQAELHGATPIGETDVRPPG